jgi:hypothetical protein
MRPTRFENIPLCLRGLTALGLAAIRRHLSRPARVRSTVQSTR